ncbi:hypothetical protein [uncultured Jannaschia sp.]|uniref:hypothetical protein n=1 Tax=uncultured Jannaschia sp. TaxID=293347 RepID=UPI0026332EA6|nr:hypothetical protein [uncultured Jannaschia sp.]
MDWSDILKVVGAIGGIASISAAVSGFVGRIVITRIVESYKSKLNLQLEKYKSELASLADRQRLLLKRQELMFEKEYAAASDFFRFYSGVVPDPWAPDLDWSDAQAEIAGNFHKHASELKKFLAVHTASISQPTLMTLESAFASANDGIFKVGMDTHGEDYGHELTPSQDVRQSVDEFYNFLKAANKQIRADLEGGSFSLRGEG